MSYARNAARLARTGIITVDTAQDLRDLTIYGGLRPEAVQTLGANTAGDGGGGLWYWDAADTTSTDNLGTVLVPTVGGAGRWKRQDTKVLYVAWFGAAGDGVTDDTTAIQAALDDTSSQIVDFGSKSYVSDPLTLSRSDVTIRNGHLKQKVTTSSLFSVRQQNGLIFDHIKFEGDGTFFFDPDSTAANFQGLLKIVSSNRVVVRNCTFDAVRTIGLFIISSQDVVLESCTVIGGPVQADYAGTTNPTVIQGIRFQDVQTGVIKNCKCKPRANGVVAEFICLPSIANKLNDILITGCICEDVWDHSVYVIGGTRISIIGNDFGARQCPIVHQTGNLEGGKSVISNNTCWIHSNSIGSTIGIYLRNSSQLLCESNVVIGANFGIRIMDVTPVPVMKNVSVINNLVKDFDGSGIHLQVDMAQVPIVQDINISGNTLSAASTATVANLGAIHAQVTNVTTTKMQQVLVANNIINKGAASGVSVIRADGFTIEGNNIIDPVLTASALKCGIYLFEATNGLISNNDIRSSDTNMTFGIKGNAAHAISNVTIHNNRLWGWQSAAMSLLYEADGCVWYDNQTHTDPLYGVITLDAGANTTILANGNISNNSGYNAYVQLTPYNVYAMRLLKTTSIGVNGAGADRKGEIDIINTLVGSDPKPVGTEQFLYKIIA